MLSIHTNNTAITAARNLNTIYNRLSKSTQRLSSGLRINSAADDAAGLAIREMMRADIYTLDQGIRNASDAISLIQTAEGALAIIDEKLIRMKELAEQAATGTYTTVQREIISSEYQAMGAEIKRIAEAAEFNGIKLLDGSLGYQHQGSGLKVHFGTGNSAAEDYYFVNPGDATKLLGETTAQVFVEYDGYEKKGEEFQVNTCTTSDQWYSSVTNLSDGGYIVTWRSDDQDGDGGGIFGQKYDAEGNQVGNEFQINTYTTDTQFSPAVTALSNGCFVIVWGSNGQDGGGANGVFGQVFDSTANQIGNEFQINTYTDFEQAYPVISSLSDGGFVVSWNSQYNDGSQWGVFAQKYDGSGTPIGNEFQVNTYTWAQQFHPSISELSDGNFIIIWDSDHDGPSGTDRGVYGQLFDSSGNIINSEFQLNDYTTGWQTVPSVTGLDNGNFVAAWQSNLQDGSGYGIYGQVYDNEGNRIGDEFRINTYTTSDQSFVDLTRLADGGFVATWISDGQDGSGLGIFGQVFDSNGNKVDTEFQANTYTANDQGLTPSLAGAADRHEAGPTVRGLDDGGFIITWESQGQDSSGYGIFAQMFQKKAIYQNKVVVEPIETQSAAQEALSKMDEAIFEKEKIRADLGALQNRLENTITNLTIQKEQLTLAESRISDVDVATEMTEFTRNNILAQAATSMLAQANSFAQLVLTLLG